MSRQVIFKPEAELDVIEAYRWYEGRDKGFGTEFKRAVDSVVCQNSTPSGNVSFVNKELRQAVTRRFPYSIFYLVEEKAVYVLAVFHASRNPQSWKDRTTSA